MPLFLKIVYMGLDSKGIVVELTRNGESVEIPEGQTLRQLRRAGFVYGEADKIGKAVQNLVGGGHDVGCPTPGKIEAVDSNFHGGDGSEMLAMFAAKPERE